MDVWRNTWANFRGFAQPQTFDFPRITLLIGRNNVGKTSAYAPLLLLRQTLSARNPDTALMTRGTTLDAGTFDDVIHNHDSERELTFGIGVNVSVGPLPQRREPVVVDRLEVSFRRGDDGRPLLHRSRILDSSGRPIVTRTRDASGDNYQVKSSLMPKSQAVGRPLREVTQLRKSMMTEMPDGFLFSGIDALRIPAEWRDDDERWSKARVWYNAAYDVHDVHVTTNWRVRRLLESISYLGPLRSLPLRTYRLSAERPSGVGRDGEFAPELLHLLPPDGDVRLEVDDWLRRLGYDSLEFEDRGDDFFQVFVSGRDSRPRVNLAHCGVGLSQILPILVQGSISRPETTFIAQQPEIHLNPAQQCLATDFLIESSSQGQRVVIETHSEHILLRLRRRIAEGQLSADQVALYYFDYEDGQTVVERIPILADGAIDRESWPQGFFEEPLSDSLALARAQSRARGAAGVTDEQRP